MHKDTNDHTNGNADDFIVPGRHCFAGKDQQIKKQMR